MTVVVTEIIETEDDLAEGTAWLAAREPVFADIYARTGLPPLRRRAMDLAGVLEIVVAQQVSKASAAAIWGRMVASLSPLTAANLARVDDARLQAAGLSRAKIATVRALAAAVLDGALAPEKLAGESDAAVRAALIAVRGIGPWTADVVLLSCLGRRDAWPAGDLALQVAVRDAFGLDRRPGLSEMGGIAQPWRPWRAVAARLLWADYAHARARDAMP